MWDQGGQPWQQWPLNQQQWMQSFQHQQDPSQIDWAALAQAWIAQREASGQQSMVEQPPGMMPNGQDMPTMESGPNNHGNFQGDSNFNRMWQPEWGMHQQPPHPPPDQPWMPPTPGPMDIVPPSEDSNSQDSGEFAPDNRHIFNQNNHNFGGPPDNFAVGPVNQFDYQHGAAFGPPQGGFHPPYWQPGPPGPPAPPQNRRERPSSFRDRQRSPIALPVKQEPPQIDAVKRRTLPAWIREGLEKMEREKQKKLEKERMEQQRSQLSKKEKKTTEDAEGGDGPRLPQRSKFDSDEEDEDAENVEAASSGKVTRSPSPVPQEEQSEPEMTEEEKEYQMMLLTKMLLTEILLDVTDEEIYYVAKDAHRKATKAPAKQLAQSSALASLTGLGGLGGYGSGDSEDERSDRGSESSDTDDEELRHRIRQKQEAFWRKEKEQQLLHDKQMEEEKQQTERVTKEMNEFIHKEQNSLSLLEARETDGDVVNEKKRTPNETTSVLEPKKDHKEKEKQGRSRSESSSSGSSSSNSRTSSTSSTVSSSSYSSSSGSSRTSSRSSSPKRKKRHSRSRSPTIKARRSRSRSYSRRIKIDSNRARVKIRERRRSNRNSIERERRRNRSPSRERRRSRSRSRDRRTNRSSRSRSRDRRKIDDQRGNLSGSSHKHKDQQPLSVVNAEE
ncbi:arginine/serine-rich protein PNISR isoform X4 [Myotis lucifugus]|uniref:arginine/serine-rich protein PNISR isoform X4 n=1 Tax=Myotis lucifugus TaxID=59463 RepID=UPI000CCBD783|nr:arginine/serine-rich protein PNISR isoform X4 [Myotis lucifugus]